MDQKLGQTLARQRKEDFVHILNGRSRSLDVEQNASAVKIDHGLMTEANSDPAEVSPSAVLNG